MSGFGSIASSKLKLKALRFDGSNERVSIGNHTEYDFERTDPFSVSVWARWATDVTGTIVHKDPSVSPFRGWFITLRSWITFQMESTTVADANQIRCDTQQSDFHNSTWHHIVVTYAGTSLASGVHIYVDNVDKSLNVPFDTLPAATIKNTAPLEWGGRSSLPHFNGDSADLAIYNKVLSAGEVTTLYNSRCPPRLEAVGPTANLKGFWRPALTDAHPTLDDLSASNRNGTMTNMEAADIFSR